MTTEAEIKNLITTTILESPYQGKHAGVVQNTLEWVKVATIPAPPKQEAKPELPDDFPI